MVIIIRVSDKIVAIPTYVHLENDEYGRGLDRRN